MTNALRIGREYAMQGVSFAINIADRILVTGLLLRAWGADGFAAWSIAAAAAGFVAFFDLGLIFCFSGKVMFAVEQGRFDRARRALRTGNFMILWSSLLGILVISIGFGFYGRGHPGVPFDLTLWSTAVLLAAATGTRIALGLHTSIYRACRDYFRITTLTAAIDAARIALTCGALLLGAGFLAVGGIQFAITLIGCAGIVWIDARRRFPAFPYGLDRPAREEINAAARTSAGFWLQSAPMTLLTFLPVFLLAGRGATAIGIAQFVLMRTIGNFVRSSLQVFAVVLGQEAARRIAVADEKGLRLVYREASIFLAAQTAAGTGILLALGAPLFKAWTGSDSLYDPVMLWLAIAPPLLVPTLTLGQTFLVSANLPWPLAQGRALQVALSVAAFLLLPIESPGMRMMAALCAGEILGLGGPLLYGVAKLNREAGWGFHGALLARSLAVAGLVYLATTTAVRLAPEHGFARLAIGLAAGSVAAALAIAWLGLDRQRRAGLILAVRRRIGGDGAKNRPSVHPGE